MASKPGSPISTRLPETLVNELAAYAAEKEVAFNRALIEVAAYGLLSSGRIEIAQHQKMLERQLPSTARRNPDSGAAGRTEEQVDDEGELVRAAMERMRQHGVGPDVYLAQPTELIPPIDHEATFSEKPKTKKKPKVKKATIGVPKQEVATESPAAAPRTGFGKKTPKEPKTQQKMCEHRVPLDSFCRRCSLGLA